MMIEESKLNKKNVIINSLTEFNKIASLKNIKQQH
jgi:hypothetical protein